MKEIEVIVKKFEANDGTRFDDKESCDKHEAECLKGEEACANRIDMIKAKRKSIDDANAEYERKQKAKLNELEERIKSMKRRISSAICIGKELRKNKFQNDFRAYSYKVGFVNSYYGGEINNIAVGVYMSRPVGEYKFATDGESVWYENEIVHDVEIKDSDKIYLCEKFLNSFDEFEKKFYDWLDETFSK